MTDVPRHVPAGEPEVLERLFVKRVNAGDIEGLMALYEPDAVMAISRGNVVVGRDQIRQALIGLVESGMTLTLGKQQPTMRTGDLALTSTHLDDDGVTAEVARRQADGTWRWVIDRWNVLDR